ncbi:MAG: GAF domain-containing protein, partial [Verrucomicrobiae bacterium]|nr:GAF domain-containing protein [Verrucomicrobiae bacterium]
MSSTARTVKKRPTASRRARSSGRAEKLSLLPQLAQVFNAKLDPNVVLQMVLGEAVKIMRANSGSLCLVNPNSNELEIEVAIGLPPGAKELKLAIGEGITGWVALHGRAARVGDVSKDARYVAVRQQVRSELAVPIEI